MKKARILGAVMAVVICLTTFFTLPTQAAAAFIEGSATIVGATKLTLGREYVVEVKKGEQWFKFDTATEDAYYLLESNNIDAHVNINNGKIRTEVCTEFKEVIFGNTNRNSTGVVRSNSKLETNTTYYLRVAEGWLEKNGNLKFKLTEKADPDKNEMADATNISINKEYNKTLSGGGDIDWFSFKTNKGTKYVLNAKNIDVEGSWPSNHFLSVTLLNAVREEIKKIEIYEGEAESTVVELEPETIYYIKATNNLYADCYTKNGNYLFSIGKPEIKAENVAVASSSYVYNGKAKKPKVTVTYGKETLISGEDYTVTYSNNVNAGKASVTVSGKGSYIGSVTKTFTIAKATQTIKVKAGSYTKALGNNSFSVAATGKGKITYITGNRKIVTVSAKGLVKLVGAGKTKITVKAAGDKNYKAATKTINITVKPKAPAKMAQPKTARLSKTKVKISWKKVSGATGYQISRAKSKTGTSIVATCKSTATNKTLTSKKGITYYYKVRAYKKVNGQTSYGAWSTVKYQK